MPNWFQRNFMGQTDFKATNPTVDAGAYSDPNLAMNQKMLQGRQAAVDARMAPSAQAATLGPMQQAVGGDLGAYNQAQQQGSALAAYLMGQATGTGGPSVADLQLRRGLEGNVASQMAIAGSMPGGGNPALAARNLQNGIVAAQLDTSGQAAMLRATEQQQAQAQLAQLLGQQGSLGLGAAGLGQNNNQFNTTQANAGTMQQGAFDQQTNLANMNAQLQAQAMKDQMTQYFVGQGLNINEANRQAQMALQQQLSQNSFATQQLNAGIAQGNAAGAANFTGGLISAAGSMGAAAIGGRK